MLPRAAGLQLVDQPGDLQVGRAQRRLPGEPGVERAGEVGVADPVDVAEVDEDQVGVVLLDHRQRRVHGITSGAWPEIGM